MIATANAASVNDAVSRAYQQGLTQYSTASSFNQYNSLRRDEAAKFYVEFAKSLGKTEYTVNAAQCNHFTDLQKAAPDLRPYIIEACKMGIFKGGNGRFYPSDKLSNEQAIAVLMRIVDGPQSENWTDWSANYYKRASELGVLDEVNMSNKKGQASRGNTVQVIYTAREVEPNQSTTTSTTTKPTITVQNPITSA
jgi:hypothetical protein